MAIISSKLMDPTAVALTATAVYANPAATKSFISNIILHNTSVSANRTVTLNNVPNSGGSLGTPVVSSNELLNLTLPFSDTLFVELPHPIVLTGTNDAIFCYSSGAGIVIQLLGATST